jgi:hypothetical protein
MFSALLGILLLIALFWYLPRDRSAGIFTTLALAAGIGLPILGGFHATRHYGIVLFVLLITWWWLPYAHRRTGASTFMSFVLGAQAFGGMLAVWMVFTAPPLSEAYRLPALLQDGHLTDRPVVVDAYTAGPSLSGYLQRPVFLTTTAAMGSYCDWTLNEFIPSDDVLLERLAAFPSRDFIWCTSRRGLRPRVEERLNADVVSLADMTEAQVPSERITVFHIVKR